MAKLDPKLTFENFVVGPANRLASAAARRAAERPGVSYNPLFIHAPSGLGKTHLLGAMARHVAKVSPGKKVAYQTAREFLRQFVQAVESEDGGGVQDRYGDLDILLLDDIQFLTTQEDVQDHLLLTLDTLTGEGKQVVLAGDRAPAEIPGLVAHLRTRFEEGLLVSIGPPEYETRVAIIRKSVEARKAVLSPGVADAIGRMPIRTVTELLTALDRILTVQEAEARQVTAAEATAIVEAGEVENSGIPDRELGEFLNEISHTVAAKVQAQESPWRKTLREHAEEAERGGFKADRLRRLIDSHDPPADLDGVLAEFQERLDRLREIGRELDAAGNPWPEAAFSVLRDPERLDEGEALLASAQERARPFPEFPPGPSLEDLRGEVPKLVIRAASQLVSTDRPEYNPLYLWSPGGLAADVLLRAAGRTRTKEEEKARVALISVSAFADEFIHALSSGVAGAWRERWWSADLLLVEGLQHLSETERAQEEVFHLMEALRRRKARIMLSADRLPGEISGLDDRLRGRIESGLVVEVPVVPDDLSPALRDSICDTAEVSASPEVGEASEENVADKDREWIKSFQTGVPSWGRRGSRGPGGRDREGLMAIPDGDRGEASTSSEPWVPSPEKVVWNWPRMEERMAEDLD